MIVSSPPHLKEGGDRTNGIPTLSEGAHSAPE